MVVNYTLMTLNAAGLNSLFKRKRIARMLKAEKQVNIICMQETHLKILETKYLKQAFKGTY